MILIDLFHFIETGEFGSVTVGMTHNEVKTILGDPDDWTGFNIMDDAFIWTYGSIRLVFRDNLYGIMTDDFPLQGGHSIVFDNWLLEWYLSLGELETVLKRREIPYILETLEFDRYDTTLRRKVTITNLRVAITNSNVWLLFHQPESEKMTSLLDADNFYLTGFGVVARDDTD